MLNSLSVLKHLLLDSLRLPRNTTSVKKSETNPIVDGILGFCVGDALGVPYEFKSRVVLKRNPASDMIGFGTHNQPPGTFSDDSSMKLCLVASLESCDGVDLNDLATRFLEWYQNGYMSARGSLFDIGLTTQNALHNIKCGVSPLQAGLTTADNNGNGPLIRILPLAFYLTSCNSSDKFRIVHDVSAVTHGHLRSQIACSIYVEFAIQLLKGVLPQVAYSNVQQTIF